MKHKKQKNKKPPTEATEGGKSEKQSGRDVFYANISTNPDVIQIDLPKFADTCRMESEYFAKLAQAADLLAEAELSLNPVYAGGTVYHIQGSQHED